jgi:putative transposase
MLNLIEEFTRECLAIRTDRRLRATDLVDILWPRYRRQSDEKC